MSYDDAPEPYYKDGWEGLVSLDRGNHIGMVVIRCRKGSRVIITRPMDPHLVDSFDPEKYWRKEV
jgi:hypothetical protein